MLVKLTDGFANDKNQRVNCSSAFPLLQKYYYQYEITVTKKTDLKIFAGKHINILTYIRKSV